MKLTIKDQLLSELGQITAMERGKLCACGHRPDGAPVGYRRLQYWEKGRNIARHVRAAEVPAVQEAINGYQRAQELFERFLELVIAETRQRLADAQPDDHRGARPSGPWRGRPRSPS